MVVGGKPVPDPDDDGVEPKEEQRGNGDTRQPGVGGSARGNGDTRRPGTGA
jgi:hypothetical protein